MVLSSSSTGFLKVFFWTLAAFSFTISRVLVPYYFCLYVCLFSASLKHKKIPNLSDGPVMCPHITDNLEKNVLNCSFKQFVSSDLLQK